MSVRSFIISVFIMLLSGSLIPAMAAAEVRDSPSNLAIWIFLGFCALIIVAELGTLLRWRPGKQSGEPAGHGEEKEELKAQEQSQGRQLN